MTTKKRYFREIQEALNLTASLKPRLITVSDLEHLPG
jgi:hypothetical protein